MNDSSGIERLLEIMRRLRNPETGCPGDLAQSFESIAPYAIEEAYEVADAIDRQDYASLRKELGDLLFQVVFHSRLAEERGLFRFDDVAVSISEKLTERHPHVFAGASFASAREQNADWERHKAAERAGRGQGTLDDLPLGLPALKRAEKLGKRAASAGFDWPDVEGARATLASELQEFDIAVGKEGSHAAQVEELGDVLFSVVNVARHLGIDPEEALRLSNQKFAARFKAMEATLEKAGRKVADESPAKLDELWREAKDSLRKQ